MGRGVPASALLRGWEHRAYLSVGACPNHTGRACGRADLLPSFRNSPASVALCYKPGIKPKFHVICPGPPHSCCPSSPWGLLFGSLTHQGPGLLRAFNRLSPCLVPSSFHLCKAGCSSSSLRFKIILQRALPWPP